MASRAHKKHKNVEINYDDQRREHLENQLFPLEYLNNSLNYILPVSTSLNTYVDLDTSILEVTLKISQNIIHGDVNKFGMHFIENVRSMKQICEEEFFSKDYQQCGDFINYDLSKENQKQLKSIQAELLEERQKFMAIKRIKQKYPDAPNKMALPELERWKIKQKKEILDSLMKNYEMIPEEEEYHLEKNRLYREMFNIPLGERKEQAKTDINIRLSKDRAADQKGINSKIKAVQNQMKLEKGKKAGVQKQERSRKISKGPKLSKKGESKVQQHQQYVPKVGKKAAKSEEYLDLSVTEKKAGINDLQESPIYIMPRRSNQLFQDKIEGNQEYQMKAQSENIAVLNKEEKIQLQKRPSDSQEKNPKKLIKGPKQVKISKPKEEKGKKLKSSRSQVKGNDKNEKVGQALNQQFKKKKQTKLNNSSEGKKQGHQRKRHSKNQKKQVSIGIQASQNENQFFLNVVSPFPTQIKEEPKNMEQIPPLTGKNQTSEQNRSSLSHPEEKKEVLHQNQHSQQRQGFTSYQQQRQNTQNDRQNAQNEQFFGNESNNFLSELNPRNENICLPSNSNVNDNEEADISDLLKFD